MLWSVAYITASLWRWLGIAIAGLSAIRFKVTARQIASVGWCDYTYPIFLTQVTKHVAICLRH